MTIAEDISYLLNNDMLFEIRMGISKHILQETQNETQRTKTNHY